MVKFMWIGAFELRLSPSDKNPVKPVLKVTTPPCLINLNNLKLFFFFFYNLPGTKLTARHQGYQINMVSTLKEQRNLKSLTMHYLPIKPSSALIYIFITVPIYAFPIILITLWNSKFNLSLKIWVRKLYGYWVNKNLLEDCLLQL